MIHRLLFLLGILVSMVATSTAFTSTPTQRLKGSCSPSQRTVTELHATKKAAAKSKSKSKAKTETEDVDDDVVNFRKAEFVAAVAEKTGMTKGDSEKALSAVLNIIASEVSNGKRISLPGFGTFKLSYRAARKGRNPKTGEEIDIKASYTPSFSASKTFKDMANPDR
eukprot:CCRYP_020654-RA/>CCRYP_020654-RA protein AED:0.31 eAED:0.31 QI:450/1/1/1/0.2/0/6/3112/166